MKYLGHYKSIQSTQPYNVKKNVGIYVAIINDNKHMKKFRLVMMFFHTD